MATKKSPSVPSVPSDDEILDEFQVKLISSLVGNSAYANNCFLKRLERVKSTTGDHIIMGLWFKGRPITLSYNITP